MFIVVAEGTNVGVVYALGVSSLTVIGRDKDCDICLLDLLASRRHCQIERKNNGFYLKDLHSTNKTYLNKHVVETEEKLENGDSIKVGNTILIFTDKKEQRYKNIEEYKKLRMGSTRPIDSNDYK